jgi:hypothetical protein
MLSKFVEALEKTFTAPVLIAAAVAILGSAVSGTFAFAQGIETVKTTDAKAEAAVLKAQQIEVKLSEHISEEVASRDSLRKVLRELRVEQFDANMNAYISCIVAKQKDPSLPFECKKPEPPRVD